MSNFHVGQHVVLIDNDWRPKPGIHSHYYKNLVVPSKGVVYTVRALEIVPSGTLVLLLVEIVNPLKKFKQGWLEPPFRASRFRPLQKLKVEDLTNIDEPVSA